MKLLNMVSYRIVLSSAPVSFLFQDCVQLNQYKLKDEIGKVPPSLHLILPPAHCLSVIGDTPAPISSVLISYRLLSSRPEESWKMDERL